MAVRLPSRFVPRARPPRRTCPDAPRAVLAARTPPSAAPAAVLPDAAPADAALRAARWAVGALFLIDGVGVASWVVRIPAVQARLALSAGALGLVLLAGSAGALLVMALAGRRVARHGSRPVARGAAIAFALTLPLPALVTTARALALALLAFGAATAALGVAINAHAATVERGYLGRGARPIMTSFHALYSAGGLVGSALGGALASRETSPAWHLAGVAAAALGAALLAPPAMLPAGADARHGPLAGRGRRRTRPRLARPSAALARLGVLAFCVLLAEGAMADWSAVYLRTVVGAGPGVAAAGYAAFSVTMALGRAVGDRLTARLGPAVVVRVGGALAVVGLVAAVLAPRAAVVVVGFGAVGAGLAVVFPLVLAAASRLPDVEPSAGIAATSAVGYAGFLAGPPLIGVVAEALSLRGGLGVVAAAALVIVGSSAVVGGRKRPSRPLARRGPR